MTRIPFCILDAFTDTPGQGNPAGVFFDDEGVLTPEQCGMICDEVHLESAFVSPADPGSGADFKLRYFTGTTRKLISRNPPALTVNVIEVPFCGHDTVATAAALVHAGRIDPQVTPEVRFQTPVGIVRVRLGADGAVTLLQNLPVFGAVADAALTRRIADALGCGAEAITATGLPVQVVSTGTPWLMAPVGERAVVDAAPSDFAAIADISREMGTLGIYVFAQEAGERAGDAAVWSRCFAPIAGLNEDPVTGSASGALGGYLARYGGWDVAAGSSGRILARQGFGGGRGGTAEIVVRRDAAGAIDRVAVTGRAVLVAEGTFRLRRAG